MGAKSGAAGPSCPPLSLAILRKVNWESFSGRRDKRSGGCSLEVASFKLAGLNPDGQPWLPGIKAGLSQGDSGSTQLSSSFEAGQDIRVWV